MSDGVLAGWAETIGLSATVTAIVQARRGAAEWRFPDDERIKPVPLTRGFVEAFARLCRTTPQGPVDFEVETTGGPIFVCIEAASTEPLIALMRRAVEFAEGAS